MHNPEEILKEFLKQQNIHKNDLLLIANSGGIDSLTLILAAKNLNLNIISVHVDHGLRQESFEQALSLSQMMKDRCIIHINRKIESLPLKNKQNWARNERYKILIEECKKYNAKYLLVAHHADDQIETFFMNLSRGSGINGLSAMKNYDLKDGIIILRPFLKLEKNDCIVYLNNKNIKHIVDSSNDDIKYLRNKIRYIISEIIEDKEIFKKRILNTINLMQEARNFIDSAKLKLYKEIININENNILNFKLEDFLGLDYYAQISLLSMIFEKISQSAKKIRLEKLNLLIKQFNDKSFKKTQLMHIKIYKINQIIFVEKSS